MLKTVGYSLFFNLIGNVYTRWSFGSLLFKYFQYETLKSLTLINKKLLCKFELIKLIISDT